MQQRYIASADLGSSKIGFTVAKIEGDDIQVIYYRETPSDGIFYSYVRNVKKASDSLKHAISLAEEELKIEIKQLVVGLPRFPIHQEIGSAKLVRTDPNTCISKEEIDILKSSVIDTFPIEADSKEEIFAAVAQSFSADDDLVRASESDIIGVPAEEIEGNFKIFIGEKKHLQNIELVFNDLGISAARRMFIPSAVATAVLTETEKENGVALIELGAGASSVTIYKDKLLRHYSSIPFGANNITNDIKYECGFDPKLCENIKLAYGACMPEKLQTLGEKVLQIQNNESGIPENLPVKYLSEIVTCRIKEIIEALLYQIQESGYADSLRSGVVITGGGSELANLGILIKSMSGYNVRIGCPRPQLFSAAGCPEATNPGAAASVGMVLVAKKDPYLNCLSEGIPERKNAEDIQNDEEEIRTTLFEEEDVLSIDSKTDKKPKRQITWTSRLSKGMAKAFDHTIGNLFDSLEE